jgi:putative transposase
MPRRSRIVIPNFAHHVTQRGGRRQNVFFLESDRDLYLNLLCENAEKFRVKILSYCLMTNHVHHLMVPQDEHGLRKTLQVVQN